MFVSVRCLIEQPKQRPETAVNVMCHNNTEDGGLCLVGFWLSLLGVWVSIHDELICYLLQNIPSSIIEGYLNDG